MVSRQETPDFINAVQSLGGANETGRRCPADSTWQGDQDGRLRATVKEPHQQGKHICVLERPVRVASPSPMDGGAVAKDALQLYSILRFFSFY